MLYDGRLRGIGYASGSQPTSRNPSGNDSPKIRTASLRPGGTYSRRLSIKAPVNPASFNLNYVYIGPCREGGRRSAARRREGANEVRQLTWEIMDRRQAPPFIPP